MTWYTPHWQEEDSGFIVHFWPALLCMIFGTVLICYTPYPFLAAFISSIIFVIVFKWNERRLERKDSAKEKI